MSAARSNPEWQTRRGREWFEGNGAASRPLPLIRQIAPFRRLDRCPECASIIYSRRHPLCGVCGHPLPEHLLFSEPEAERVERLLRSEQGRHRVWMKERSKHEPV